MATIGQKVTETMHTIKAWLYPNHLKDVKGKFVAKAEAEALLGIEEVSADSISRGDVTGNYNDMLRYVNGFMDQAIHQLLDGFSINFGYFSIHPSISGTYDSVNEPFDKEKHQFRLSFRTRDRLRKLIDETVAVSIQGIANVQGFVDQIFDVVTKLIDEILTPGHDIHVTGSKIKIAGTGADIGFFFINTLGDRFKAAEININTPGMLSIRVPDNLAPGLYTIEIVTQYVAGSAKLLKEARVISYPVQLRVKS
ncbi:hypothetical protein Barb6XT_01952 [Bacteroidales bacterium Barb6XT]|nr:hypothetical protein Barb6XT_01952 [Bacteroidales bacterium Barb6XT]